MGQVDSMQLLQLMRMLELMHVGALESLTTTKKTPVVEHVFRRRVKRPVVALACRNTSDYTAIEHNHTQTGEAQTRRIHEEWDSLGKRRMQLQSP